MGRLHELQWRERRRKRRTPLSMPFVRLFDLRDLLAHVVHEVAFKDGELAVLPKVSGDDTNPAALDAFPDDLVLEVIGVGDVVGLRRRRRMTAALAWLRPRRPLARGRRGRRTGRPRHPCPRVRRRAASRGVSGSASLLDALCERNRIDEQVDRLDNRAARDELPRWVRDDG